jgi:hypothetical protein
MSVQKGSSAPPTQPTDPLSARRQCSRRFRRCPSLDKKSSFITALPEGWFRREASLLATAIAFPQRSAHTFTSRVRAHRVCTTLPAPTRMAAWLAACCPTLGTTPSPLRRPRHQKRGAAASPAAVAAFRAAQHRATSSRSSSLLRRGETSCECPQSTRHHSSRRLQCRPRRDPHRVSPGGQRPPQAAAMLEGRGAAA